MPTTRKKVIKAVYKDDGSDEEIGDFCDSGSEAQISEESSSDEEEVECGESSGDEFKDKVKTKNQKRVVPRKSKFAKTFVNKINKQITPIAYETEDLDAAPVLFSVKDLSDADKLLPSVLNLSESDSSDDECQKVPIKKNVTSEVLNILQYDNSDSKNEEIEYKDVWSNNIQDNSVEIAKKTFLALELHKTKIEEAKATLQNYLPKEEIKEESNVKDLLAQGEEVVQQKKCVKKKTKPKYLRDDSDSDVGDWEEVKESKTIPQQGLQLIVEIPDAVCRKSKKVDVEMMMKRKINRVKKEYQVYMHKVHVLCWLGHGNFISHILNEQELMAATLSLVPSKNCYPEDRVDVKYVEQIATWYKDKLTLKQDKHENKFRPKSLPLKIILLEQIKNRVVTTRKYLVFIFAVMLRALGLQCRIMFNFVTLPIKPPSSELCSLSTKPKGDKVIDKQEKLEQSKQSKKKSTNNKSKPITLNLSQVDGSYDYIFHSDSDIENIMQVDGSDDVLTVKSISARTTRANKTNSKLNEDDDNVSPPKRSRKYRETLGDAEDKKKRHGLKLPQKRENLKYKEEVSDNNSDDDSKSGIVNNEEPHQKSVSLRRLQRAVNDNNIKIAKDNNLELIVSQNLEPATVSRRTRSRNNKNIADLDKSTKSEVNARNHLKPPKILISDNENQSKVPSKYFDNMLSLNEKTKKLPRKRSHTSESPIISKADEKPKVTKIKSRTKSAPENDEQKSKYFNDGENDIKKPKLTPRQLKQKQELLEEQQRVSHRDITGTSKAKTKIDVTTDLVDIIKNRIKDAKSESKRGTVKGRGKKELEEGSNFLPEEEPKRRTSESDEEFKHTKISPKPSTSRVINRRILSSDEESTLNKNNDVWCEVYVEELEQWICVDVIRGKVHCTKEIYNRATHPVTYVVGWDNNNYLKDLTRRYVPHWNTVTRKIRAEPTWWTTALQPWLGPKTARDKEEDEFLDRMQLEAPLPKSIAEYKNHPLYALKRHLLKFEAIYPPDAATLGFVRGEAVYARECVYTCRSRDTWLKEAKVVRLREQPYKVVKARPKWDKLSNKLITDKPLEVFGPWQVQDYEPPVAENGIVPRNAYGNVELFKDCMLPKGTVHIKLPGLNKVAKKLNIDCAPAMTGFDFNGGWSHPVYDGFVVCKEFEQIITEAWVEEQEQQERREREKTELRVYGNWKRLIKGLLIRERLKIKYGFAEPSTSPGNNKKSKGPRLVVKKKI